MKLEIHTTGMKFSNFSYKEEIILHNSYSKNNLTTEEIDEQFFLKTNKECDHSWKLYVGIINQYEYCIICDEKRI